MAYWASHGFLDIEGLGKIPFFDFFFFFHRRFIMTLVHILIIKKPHFHLSFYRKSEMDVFF